MKRYIKYLIGLAFFISLYVNGLGAESNKAYATGTMLRDPDIYPPTGSISVEGANYTDGKWYISSENITLNITAEDNKTESDDLMMLLSGDKVSEEDLNEESNWEPYAPKKDWKLSEGNNGTNRVYLYLKDMAGNISNTLMLSSSNTYTVTYAGEGISLPVSKKAKFGVAFNVSTEAPENGDKYFIGWSLTENGSVQWGRDGIIEPQYITGDTTLYAVWSDVTPALADVVAIGDYVDYPVAYTNVEGYNTDMTGWRVIGFDGDKVKLVSAGTPLGYSKQEYAFPATSMIKELTTNFLTTSFYKNGFTSTANTTVGDAFANKYTASVSSLTYPDLQFVTDGKITYGENIQKYGSLIRNGSPYFLATKYLVGKYQLYCVHNINSDTFSLNHGNEGNYLGTSSVYQNNNYWFSEYGTSTNPAAVEDKVQGTAGRENATCGIRPVVTLHSDIITEGRTDDGVWMLTDMQVGSSVAELKAAGLAVGDYIKYDADNNLGLSWRVFSIEGDTVNLTLNGNGTKYEMGPEDYKDAIVQLNNECANLYSNSEYGITARSMTLDDLNRAFEYTPTYTTGYKFYPIGTPASQMETTVIDGITYTPVAHGSMSSDSPEDFGAEPKFYIIEGSREAGEEAIFGDGEIQEDSRGKYLVPTVENPVYVRNNTYYLHETNTLNSTISSMFETGNYCWLASSCACVYSETNRVRFCMRIVHATSVNAVGMIYSDGNTKTVNLALRPIVSINARLLEKAADGNTHEWRLKDKN